MAYLNVWRSVDNPVDGLHPGVSRETTSFSPNIQQYVLPIEHFMHDEIENVSELAARFAQGIHSARLHK